MILREIQTQVLGTGGNRTLDPRIKSPVFNGDFLQKFDFFPLSLWPDLPQKTSAKRKRLRDRRRPWTSTAVLRCVPSRLSTERRRRHLFKIVARCATTAAGCWLYPAVRDETYPYLDVTGDNGERQQWSARRYVWALVNGDIPEGGIMLGRCQSRACVWPGHQWLWVPPKQLQLLGDDSRGDV
jgi:hypothetical protein